tara:strand:+ start:3931 stop:4230 length:300 start_codon:yes stop_codon:yes gene_type:complete
MNWFNQIDNEERLRQVKAALMFLRYTSDIDPATASFEELQRAIASVGDLPDGISLDRFTAMIMSYARNHEEIDDYVGQPEPKAQPKPKPALGPPFLDLD